AQLFPITTNGQLGLTPGGCPSRPARPVRWRERRPVVAAGVTLSATLLRHSAGERVRRRDRLPPLPPARRQAALRPPAAPRPCRPVGPGLALPAGRAGHPAPRE